MTPTDDRLLNLLSTLTAAPSFVPLPDPSAWSAPLSMIVDGHRHIERYAGVTHTLIIGTGESGPYWRLVAHLSTGDRTIDRYGFRSLERAQRAAEWALGLSAQVGMFAGGGEA